MDAADRRRTLAGRHRTELERIKGSRFVADAAPVADESEARGFVAEVRAREPDATHHCWAFRLHDGRALVDDDGEPRDTAGAPILRHLEGADVTDVVVVVTRWFGGTKLGRGGLIRAYGDATAAVLADASIVDRPILVPFEVAHDYDLSGAVEAVLTAHDASVLDASYGARVTLRVGVPRASADAFRAAMTEATAGRVTPS